MKTVAQQIEPLFDRVLVQRLAPESISEGGIKIPETAQHHTGRAKVVALGPGCKALKIDDEVMLSQYSGVDFEFDKVEYLIVREEEVILRLL